MRKIVQNVVRLVEEGEKLLTLKLARKPWNFQVFLILTRSSNVRPVYVDDLVAWTSPTPLQVSIPPLFKVDNRHEMSRMLVIRVLYSLSAALLQYLKND